jgi:hypothetical protein
MKMFILLALFGYIIYILVIRPIVINAKFGKDKPGIPLPEGLDDSIKLLEYLREKGFTYPEFKNMRHNELGQVVIEGKYSSHAVTIKDNTLYVDLGKKGGTRKQTNCILEAVVIGHYLSKLFNPSAPVDAYKQFTSFKKRRWQPIIIIALLFCAFLIPAVFMAEEELVPQIASDNISSSYLSEYSSEVTIGDAFKNFFGDPKWKSYEQGIQKFVDFQGGLMLDNEPAVAVITFSVSGEKFKVESAKIDNEELNPLDLESFFQTIYSEE